MALGERKDGRRVIVSGSWDNTVRLWDLESGEALTVIAAAAVNVALGKGTLLLGKSDGLVAIRI